MAFRHVICKYLALSLFTLAISRSNAQFKISDALGKAKKAVAKVSPDPWKPGGAITTSIKDTLYGFAWMTDDLLAGEVADTIGSFNLRPGYYKTTIRSYCLHAGVYGPTKGDGYQIANLKGMKSKVVEHILAKSAIHPEIPQQHVQQLIWGIESGTRFSNYQPAFQLEVRPLLTEAEIAAMQVDVSQVANKTMPADVRETLNTYESLRRKMQDSQAKYDEIESIAVKTGAAPLGLGSKVIDAGIWSYIGDGFYLKASPQGYPRTEIELYRPAKPDIKRDSKNRISSYSLDGYAVAITYNDAAGQDMLQVDGRKIPVWKIKSYKLTGPSAGQSVELPVNDWLFRGNMADIASIMENAPVATLAGHGPDAGIATEYGSGAEPTWQDVQQGYKDYRKWEGRYKEYKGYYDEYNDIKNPPKLDEYIEESAVNKRIHDGLKAAMNPLDKKGQMTWIRKNLRMTLDLTMYAICMLRGDCTDNDPRTPDLPSHPAQPGNTSKQRIGLSPYKAD
ncbi:MAG: hypothetical protein EOO09_13650 [Chitinophagaceae bacterium]|nr:MAG: hypothetical protein EOO09_13650 [Chitinophagaceae bacterium]